MTDHGNLFGAIDFYQTAVKMGVKPIIGCEAYLATAGSRLEKTPDIKVTPLISSCLPAIDKDIKIYSN